MDFKDYYKVLQVEPEADAKAIKTAYRKLARKYHPDVSKEKDAETQFKEVSEAYEVLHNPEKRAEYDELRKYGRQGQPFQGPPGWQPRGRASGGGGTQFFDEEGGDFSDFFSNIFGASGRGGGFNGRAGSAGRRGQDVEMELPVSLEETLSDEPKAVSFQVGQQPGKTLNVKIPVGVVDGERIRLKGQGGAGAGGGANGDLYLVIRLAPHPLFDLEGQDLIITVALAPWEAALGAKVAVPTLGGRINMTIPANSQAGQRLRVKGRGLRNKQGGQGDLYAQLKVVMPKAGDDATEQLWRELAEKAAFDPRSEWSK